VNWLNGADAKPAFVPPRPYERGVAGRPTLVQNVETLCDIALIGRFGAAWYRSSGTRHDPGTTLLTLSGAVARPGVYEIPLGVRLGDVVAMSGTDPKDLSAVLIGGYFGAWLPADTSADVRMGVESLRRVGSGLGAGVVFAMPRTGTCPLGEIARVTRWLADENAGQCGPCVNGLDAIAHALRILVAGDRDRRAQSHVERWLSMMEGRGACKHPDGVARFVASGLRVFSGEIERHRRHGPSACRDRSLLPTPRTGGWR
jgi:NADH:ubiquinone oxidoreductase subunit F (NADH-binding)